MTVHAINSGKGKGKGAKAKASGGTKEPRPVTTCEADGQLIKLPPPTLKDKAVSAALWGAGGAWLMPTMMTCIGAMKLFSPQRVDWLNRIHIAGQMKICTRSWKAEVHPDVRPDVQYMFAHNHTNHLDYALCYMATPHFKQGLNLEKHFSYPFYGWWMKARGTVGVNPGAPDAFEKMRDDFRTEVAEGRSLLVFPEGTRTRSGRVERFRKGVFLAARDIGVPVVPTAATGAFEMMNPESLLMRRADITVHMMKPMETEGLSDAEIADLAEECRRQVAEKVDAWHRKQGLLA